MKRRTVEVITPSKLHKRLREACKDGGGARLADKAGVSPWTVYGMRDGKQKISEPVARALGVERIWIAK